MLRAGRELAIILALAAVLALITVWLRPQDPPLSLDEVLTLSVAEAIELAQPVLWIDARSEHAYDKAHIPRALRLTEHNWEALLPQIANAWDPEHPVVVYCDQAACDASRQVALRLKRELRMEMIYTLKGGWSAWSQNTQSNR